MIGQLTEISQQSGAPGKLARKLLVAARDVFGAHRTYLQDGRDLAWLKAELDPHRDRIRELLEQGARGRHPKTARFCSNLLDEYVALWTFCEVPGIDPTNNAAERALRHAVILRKISLGTQSEHGSRWIERICSVRRNLPPATPIGPRLPHRRRDRRSTTPARTIARPDLTTHRTAPISATTTHTRNRRPHPDTP